MIIIIIRHYFCAYLNFTPLHSILPSPFPTHTVLSENFTHREDVRRTLRSSKEWGEYVKLAAESVTEPVGGRRGAGEEGCVKELQCVCV